MTTKHAPINWLEWTISVLVPTLAFALFAAHQGEHLPSIRVLWLGVPLGAALVVVNRTAVHFLNKGGLRDEVLLQTLLRVVLSVGLAVVYGGATL